MNTHDQEIRIKLREAAKRFYSLSVIPVMIKQTDASILRFCMTDKEILDMRIKSIEDNGSDWVYELAQYLSNEDEEGVESGHVEITDDRPLIVQTDEVIPQSFIENAVTINNFYYNFIEPNLPDSTNVTSGYRSVTKNQNLAKKFEGTDHKVAVKGFHTRAMALDFSGKQGDITKLFDLITKLMIEKKIPLGGVARSKTMLHWDIRGWFATWSYGDSSAYTKSNQNNIKLLDKKGKYKGKFY